MWIMPDGKQDNRDLDWKQLGIMLSYIVCNPEPISHIAYHDPLFPFPQEVNVDYTAIRELWAGETTIQTLTNSLDLDSPVWSPLTSGNMMPNYVRSQS